MTNRYTSFVPGSAMLLLLLALVAWPAGDISAQTLSATRVAADSAIFVANPKHLDFGIVPQNGSKTLTFTVSNPGNIRLNILFDLLQLPHLSYISGYRISVNPPANVDPGGSQGGSVTFESSQIDNGLELVDAPGAYGGSLVFNHNSTLTWDYFATTSTITWSAYVPKAQVTQSVAAGATTATVPLGSTGLQIQFANTGTGGTITASTIPGSLPKSTLVGGQTFTPTGDTYVISASGLTGASFDLTFPNAGGSGARLAYRPEGSAPDAPWILIEPGKTVITGNVIIAKGIASFSEWTVLTPGTLAPTLTSLEPDTMLVGERSNVIVKGTNFSTVSTFDFGAGVTVNSVEVPVTGEAIVNVTVAPDAAVGVRDVKVTNPAPGGGTATLTGAFTVLQALTPTIASIAPNGGNRGATVSVTLAGTNFGTATTVSAGGGITVGNVVVTSPTSLTADFAVPTSTVAGAYDVTVSNGSGFSAFLIGGFTARNLAPTVASVSPASADRGKSTTVSITGTGFETGVTTGVSFGAGITVTSFTVTNATTISAVLNIPTTAAGGVRDVSVTNATPGGGTATQTGAFTVTIPVSVEGDGEVIPETFVLEDAYPNPFNPVTTIRFGLPERSSVTVQVYDVSGRMVAQLVNDELQAGMFRTQWNAGSASSGTYLVRMTAKSADSNKTFSTSKKVSLVK